MHVLVLNGSARERGRVHGEALRPEIQSYLEGWKTALAQDLGSSPDAYLAQFLADTSFLAAIRRWTPDLLEEVQGISEGARVDFDIILALQLGDEEWWYRRQVKHGRAAGVAGGCSALGIYGQPGSPPILAQNMDVPIYHDGYQTLLRIREPKSSLETLVFTTAGFIALNGLNSQAVGVCVNALLQLDYAADGLPVAFVIRGILAQQTAAAAVAFAQRVRHASGQNYLIGGKEEIVDLECSANKAVRFVPHTGAKRLYHTNHPLVNDDDAHYRAMLDGLSSEQREQADKGQANTESRLRFLESQLADPSRTLGVEDVQAMLSAHEAPICVDRGVGKSLTLGCTVMELSADPALHLAPGPPCSTAFEVFRFG
jgi:predicted choloylglycine hydrolase